MSDLPAVSVVIPLYNKGPHITRALNSVLLQTFQDFEIIVADGHSTDEGPEIVKRYNDPRIHFFIQESTGVSAARNQGVNRARSDFIAFLDADDEWLPEHLEILLRLRKEYPRAGAYGTAYKICQPDSRTGLAHFKAIPPFPWEGVLPSYFKANALGDHPLFTSSAGVPREIFFDAGGFPLGVRYGEDEDLWGKIALRHPIVFSWQTTAIYHRDATNRACDNIPLEEEVFVKTARLAILQGSVPVEIQDDLNECLARKEIDRAKLHLRTGDPKTALDILARCDTKLLRQNKNFWRLLAITPAPIRTMLYRCNRCIFGQNAKAGRSMQ